MKMVIMSEQDVEFLQGKFILQINTDEPNKTLMDMGWGFAKEKRLRMIVGNGYVDLYGYRHNFGTFENFMDWFNEYSFDSTDKGGERFHRLLTSKELDYLCTKMKEENF